jgi:ABC-type glycerol-3-phosphate transport system substrate-binding protein
MKKQKFILIVFLIAVFISSMFSFAGVVGAEEGVTKIKFANVFWLEPGRKEQFERYSKAFEEKFPQYKIEPIAIPYNEYTDKMKILLASDPPDLLQVYDQQIKLWADQGYLEPLDDYLDFTTLMDEFASPAAQKVAEIDGKMYGIYELAGTYSGLIYNKKMLQDAGVEVPKTPDELITAALKLTKAPDQYGFIAANTPQNPAYLMQHAMITINGFGGRIVKEDGTFGINSPEFIEGVKFYKKLYDSGVVPKAMDYTTQRKLFFAGKAAMCQDGGYFVSWTESENPNLKGLIDLAPLPYPKNTYPLEVEFFSISSKSSPEVKKGAVEWLKFFLTPEIQADYLSFAVEPVTMKAAITEKFKKQYPWFRVTEAAVPVGIPLVLAGYETQTPEIRKIVSDYIGKVLQLNEDPTKAMNDCQKEIEALVSK